MPGDSHELTFTSLTVGQDHAQTTAFLSLRGDPAFVPDAATPGTEGVMLMRGGVAVARVSVYVAHDLVGATGRIGLIGHYEAVDTVAGIAILDHATRVLQARGVTRILGPMNGSTWMRYRFALPQRAGEGTTSSDPFAGEPTNPPEYPAHWLAAGFREAEYYESACEPLDSVQEPWPATQSPEEATAADGSGIHVRRIALDTFDDELRTLHHLSTDAFAENAFYSPIDLVTFRALYAPFAARLDPAFVLLAERAPHDALGFVFAYPDPLHLRNGQPTRLIVKTLAVAHAARGLRISSLLLDRIRHEGRERGLDHVISALMRSDNATIGMAVRRNGRLFRRYALYHRDV